MELADIVADFAVALTHVDARRPVAVNQRSKAAFQPGIGPHSEAVALKMIAEDMSVLAPDRYSEVSFGVPYPSAPRQKCDLRLVGTASAWALEVKLLRFRGDNGHPNDNILMHILSPYAAHRSALTDCEKLSRSGFSDRKAILIYGFDDEEWPLEPAIAAFEALAATRASLKTRQLARSGALCHPVHKTALVYGWELVTGEHD
jgi:hypothetical protein